MVVTNNRGTYDMPSDFQNDDAKMIQKCLNCKRSECNDCLDKVYSRHTGRGSYKEEYVIPVFKGDCGAREMAAKLGVDPSTVYTWLKRYCFEHNKPYPSLRRRRIRKW